MLNVPFVAYKGNDSYIFISYSHKDTDKVFEIITKLYDLKFNIWYDEGIDPGNEWPEEIAKALENASLFIVFFSNNSSVSVNVRNEINFALSDNIPFLAVYLEDTQLSAGIKLQIGSKQAIMKFKMDDNAFFYKIQSAISSLLHIEHTIQDLPIQKQKIEPKLEQEIEISKEDSELKIYELEDLAAKFRNSAKVEYDLGKFQEAIPKYIESIKYYKIIINQRNILTSLEWLAHVLVQLGICYDKLLNYPFAVNAYQDSIVYYEKFLSINPSLAKLCLGITYLNASIAYSNFDLNKAIVFCQKSIEYRNELKDTTDLAGSQYSQSKNYLETLKKKLV